MPTDPPIFLHVGFANTGTTSLQKNFFARRDDIFLAGEPYGERGGIFTAIKSIEDFQLDRNLLEKQCRELVYARANGRPIVISDENLCDTPELYFGPYVVPRDTIALRLKHFFPAAKIIFTIRDQRQYALSAYFNLKRNAAFFDGMPTAPLASWLSAMLSRERSHFMQNLNFYDVINLYCTLFGRENVCVLPLEMLVADGADSYLGKLCDFLGLPFSRDDAAHHQEIHNQRMSQRHELIAELLADSRFSRFYAELTEHLSPSQLDGFLNSGPRATADLRADDEERIRQRVGLGNWLLAKEFGLDLGRYGYPMAADGDFSARQLTVARQELAFCSDLERLSHDAASKEMITLRQAAEVARLRRLEMELMTVRRSPVWRTVERLDRIRRRFVRASPQSRT
jgi:hypothetical protein